MGRKRQYAHKKNGSRGQDNHKNKRSKHEAGYGEWILTNDDFVEYYQAQALVTPEEWPALMASLATPLPTTFRINQSCEFAAEIRQEIVTDFQFSGLEIEGELPSRP